jgi:hypothetical protein
MLTYADVCVIQAYVHTGRIINITVSPGNAFEAARLLNYLTAPNVLVCSAIEYVAYEVAYVAYEIAYALVLPSQLPHSSQRPGVQRDSIRSV